ncbi:MAG: phosphoribosylformylglycinamidine synthase subunit PurQ [Phycisphaerales bacterium]
MPKALVIRAAGTNCDTEMVRAFVLAGASCETAHLDRVIAEPAMLERFDLLGFPGGFSYGDDVASGRVFAMRLRERLYGPLRRAVERGACVIGACNGFQILVQVGLLPGGGKGDAAPEPVVALTDNIGNRFIDRWLRVEVVASSVCVWTRGLAERWSGDGEGSSSDRRRVDGDHGPHRLEAGATNAGATNAAMTLPIAHGEGRFVATSPAVIEALEAGGQVALRYIDNDNGSTNRIAGICDPTGRVFGLMPHPERYLSWGHHPFATALPDDVKRGDTPGLMMFKNAVEAVTHARA